MEPLGMGSLQLLSRVAAQRSCHSCCETASSSVTDTRHAARVASADTNSKPSNSMLAAAWGIGCAVRNGGGEGRTRVTGEGRLRPGVLVPLGETQEMGRGKGSGGCEVIEEREEKDCLEEERRHEATRGVTLFVCLFVCPFMRA